MAPTSEPVPSVELVDDRTGSRWPIVDAGRTWPVAVAVWGVAAIVDYLRLPTAARDTLYAEDGRTFLGDWLTAHSIDVLVRPYAGYQHLLPRVAGGLVTGLLPVSWWANAMTLIACLLVGGSAALVYVFSRDVVSAPIARLGLAAITVLTPLAGVEAVGNMANLHWYLIYLVFWLLLAIPRSRAGGVLMVVLALVTTLTEPQCAVLLPLAVYVFVRRPASRPVVIAWLVGVLLQLWTYLSHPRVTGAGFPPLDSAIKGFLVNAAMSNGYASGERLGRVIASLGWWTAWAALVGLLAFAAYAIWRGRTPVRIAVVGALYASAASWLGSFYINDNPAYFYGALTNEQLTHLLLVRWGTAAAMLLVSVVPLAAGVLIERSPRRWPFAAGIVGLMVLVMGASVVSPSNGRAGVPWDVALTAASDECRSTPTLVTIRVPTYPAGWPVPVPCSDLR